MPDLIISATLHDSGQVLTLDGEIDMATEARFQEAVTAALTTQPRGRVVLDCSDLRFIDSSGLRVLIRALKAAKEQKALLVIAAPVPRVLQTLHVTSLDTRIAVFPSVAQALAAPVPRVLQTLQVTSLDTRIPVFASVAQALAAPQPTS